MNFIEKKIILNVLLLLQNNEIQYKEIIKKDISGLAKFYNFKIKSSRAVTKSIHQCLIEFLKNEQGYLITLNNLYNSVANN